MFKIFFLFYYTFFISGKLQAASFFQKICPVAFLLFCCQKHHLRIISRFCIFLFTFREGIDKAECAEVELCVISIQAPAERTTEQQLQPGRLLQISILAPAKGAARLARSTDHTAPDFNPCSREGSDRHGDRREAAVADFNPHSREGSDAYP